MYYSVKNTYNADENKKVIKKGILIFIVFTIVISSLILLAFTSQGSKPIHYKEINIKKGDTLWGIVSTINIHNQDPRKLINQIKNINNLNDVRLQPGQIIKIPYYK